MKNRAATAVVVSDGYMVGYADRNVRGYTPTTYHFGTYEEAKACAASLNENAFGVTPDEALGIIASSMSFA